MKKFWEIVGCILAGCACFCLLWFGEHTVQKEYDRKIEIIEQRFDELENEIIAERQDRENAIEEIEADLEKENERRIRDYVDLADKNSDTLEDIDAIVDVLKEFARRLGWIE